MADTMIDFQMPSWVTDARKTASDALTTAGDFATKAQTIPDQLKSVINDALKTNKEIVDTRSKTLSSYLASPAVAEAKYSDPTGGSYIFNPFERNKAIAQYISAEEVPFMTSNTLLGNILGSGQDIVEAGTRRFKEISTAKEAAAKAAQQAYTNVLNEFTTGQELAFKTAQEKRNAEMAPLEKQKLLAEIGNLSAAAKEKLGTGGLDLSKAIQIYNAVKPSAAQEAKAASAESALASIESAKAIMKKNPKALWWSGQGSLIRQLGGGDAVILNKDLSNLRDLVTRARTGAALNKEEEAFYQSFIADPWETFGGKTYSVDKSLEILNNIFKKDLALGRDPREIITNALGVNAAIMEDPDFQAN